MTKGTVTSVTLTMSVDALDHLTRALADRGIDYGWDVYHKGTKIPASAAKQIVEDDEYAAGWLEAFRVALKAYRTATGEGWRY